mgnify:CR=1 FL=1
MTGITRMRTKRFVGAKVASYGLMGIQSDFLWTETYGQKVMTGIHDRNHGGVQRNYKNDPAGSNPGGGGSQLNFGYEVNS